jgi:hypothetical protein
LEQLDVSKNIALVVLHCYYNKLKALDVSHNTLLKSLKVGYGGPLWVDATEVDKFLNWQNQLTTLDVSKNIALTHFDCTKNRLTELYLKHNTELMYLWCAENQLSILDMNKNVKLKNIDCSDNKLTILDISENIVIEDLSCSKNFLKHLDVSKNVELEDLGCSDNQLTTLDISKNIELENLYCYGNQLTVLDVSKNIKLRKLYCFNNQLSSQSLNALFHTLPIIHNNTALSAFIVRSSIDVSGNPGVKNCNKSIAENRGWTISISFF